MAGVRAREFTIPDVNGCGAEAKLGMKGGRIEIQEFGLDCDEIKTTVGGQITAQSRIGDSRLDLRLTTEAGPAPITTEALFGGRTVALFSVPGAFTPTCSAKHLPGFVTHADEIKARGIDEIVCISVNDVFVMGAWGKNANVGENVTMLADGNGDFVKALGLTMDGSKFGMGLRGQRFSMLVKDGKVVELNIEEPGAFKVSSAEHLLEQLK
jgi:peroxiredoxin